MHSNVEAKIMRRAAKKDHNHNELSDAFKSFGCSVADTSRLGNDFPDMIIGLLGINVLIEIKRDDVSPSKSKLTDGQFKFLHEWRGWTAVVRNVDDALRIVNQIKQDKVYHMRGFSASAPGNQFARDCLDPEKYGLSVSAEVRNAARVQLGMPACEPEN
jgi:hypothetical protein